MKKLFYIEIFPFVPGVTPCFQNWINFLVGIDIQSIPLFFFDQSIFFHKKENTIFFSNQEFLAFRSNQNLAVQANTFFVGKEFLQPANKIKELYNSQIKTKELLHLFSFPAWYPTVPPKRIQLNIQPYQNSFSHQVRLLPLRPSGTVSPHPGEFLHVPPSTFVESSSLRAFPGFARTRGEFLRSEVSIPSKKMSRNSEKNKRIFLSTKLKYRTPGVSPQVHMSMSLCRLPLRFGGEDLGRDRSRRGETPGISWSISKFPIYPKDIEILSKFVTKKPVTHRALTAAKVAESSSGNHLSSSANQDCTNRKTEIDKSFLTFFQSESFFEKIKLEYSYQMNSRDELSTHVEVGQKKKLFCSFSFDTKYFQKTMKRLKMKCIFLSKKRFFKKRKKEKQVFSTALQHNSKISVEADDLHVPPSTFVESSSTNVKERVGEIQPHQVDLKFENTLCFQNIRSLFYYGILYV